jgi:hypothetical protein
MTQSIGNLKVVKVMNLDVPRFLAILFTILTVLFMFDFFRKVMRWLGFKLYDFSGNEDIGVIVEAKKIVAQEENVFYDELEEKLQKQKRFKTISREGFRESLLTA